MHNKNMPFVAKSAQILFILMALTAILYIGRSVLIPLAFAFVLAMLLLSPVRWLERKGLNRTWSALAAIIMLIAAFTLIFGLIGWQLSSILKDAGQIKQQLAKVGAEATAFISDHTGLTLGQQKKALQNADVSAPLTFLFQGTGSLFGILVAVVLTLVYVFLLLIFRNQFMKFVSEAVPSEQKENVQKLIRETGKVSQEYLTGLALMIMSLWIMYGIGFSIVGVRYALFFALLCGTLEMVPFVGNITGTTLTALMGIIQGGDASLVLYILLTYGMVQFIQSYILQPLVVGRQVDLNPFFTIFCIVAGEAVWGVAGMVLAIPLFGMIRIVCGHFDTLKPYGFLLGGYSKSRTKVSWFDKLKSFFTKKG
ncbi:AI-2E family transporter [Mucilaginibacter sp. RCC_168]|jgi:predicted PurR-regulated permease PerM|uniref:AI-2E family transporter n=1 Tax=Mucilaginibacter sp. RCC_168 TaxID=3239221 RepID=UPI003524ABD0